MGVSITVAALAYLRENDEEGVEWLVVELRKINRLLLANNIPPHVEPEILPPFQSRYRHVGMPYGMLHHLRRAVAYALRNHARLPAFPADENPSDDEMYERVLDSFESHIICHSDCEGFYVPSDFPEPLYDKLTNEDPQCICGGILGSSQGALRELLAVAPLLDIHLQAGFLNDQDFARIHDERQEEHPHWIARQVWLKFYEIARFSIEHNTAIVFL